MDTVKEKSAIIKDIYGEVTQAVIEALENGTVPWRCSWHSMGLAKNMATGRTYRGWNVFWLNYYTWAKHYRTPYYVTYKQAEGLGGKIKRGEKGTHITYWVTVTPDEKTPTAAPIESTPPAERIRVKLVPKVYTVFNADQTEGLDFVIPAEEIRIEAEKIQACEDLILQMPDKPLLQLHGDSAYYIPSLDTVVVPGIERSISPSDYYSTLFHELGHATGHAKRLNREELTRTDGHGNTNYCKEELTAELTSAYLCAVTGIGQETLENSAAYLSTWLSALKNDKKLLLKAASQAQKAADYILNDFGNPEAHT